MAVSGAQALWVCRHLETEKNRAGIHGTSDLAAVTERGRLQAKRLADQLASPNEQPFGVLATPTPQAGASAQWLAKEMDLEYEGYLVLEPIQFGIASGLTNAELRATDPSSYDSLDRFRARAVDITAVEIEGLEAAQELENRLVAWWASEGADRCAGRLIVGSNSTVLMLTHLFQRTLPSTGRYLCFGIPNGAMRRWAIRGGGVEPNDAEPTSWPDVEMTTVGTRFGRVAHSRHAPGWQRRHVGVVVAPGYFGSSRHGPYGLYTRLARAWAFEGFETNLIDPLGAGDSTAVHRTFETEVESIRASVVHQLRTSSHVVVVAHSMAIAAALIARRAMTDSTRVSVWSLAPLCSQRDLSIGFFSESQWADLRHLGVVHRHGVRMEADYLAEADAAWNQYRQEVDRVWVGGADVYTSGQDLSPLPQAAVSVVPQADHNFSAHESAAVLEDETLACLFDVEERAWQSSR